ncbi:MAG: hypothetical protein KDD19_18190 [Phaeodactylibacter sp.]|nr:hypothetical protein [Phaeodactylibacter sp.]MCB9052844.1 hypothetical protein [Lewinellaceae bacterium]
MNANGKNAFDVEKFAILDVRCTIFDGALSGLPFCSPYIENRTSKIEHQKSAGLPAKAAQKVPQF